MSATLRRASAFVGVAGTLRRLALLLRLRAERFLAVKR